MNKLTIFTLLSFLTITSGDEIDFQHNGWWYEYFSGDSIQINGTSIISLDPGDYKVFTDLKLDKPEILNTLGFNEYEIANWDVNIFPNPSIDFLNITN